MFTTTIKELTACNTCHDGTGSVYFLAAADTDGYATIKFLQPGTNTVCGVRIWLNNGKDPSDPSNNCIQHEETLPANTKNKLGIARLHKNTATFRVRKGMRIYATLTVAQADPIVVMTTIESNP